jgi:plasmid stabilization system protein ParE
MTRLLVTAEADADASQILSYLEREAGPRIADDYERRFNAAIERLADVPGIGAPRRSLGPNTRIMVIYPYILVYDHIQHDDTVTVLRILHGRRDITRDLLNR